MCPLYNCRLPVNSNIFRTSEMIHSENPLTAEGGSGRMNVDEEIFRTAKNGKVYMINTETGETSGLGPDIDSENAAAVTSAIDINVKPVISDTNMQDVVNEIYKGQGQKGQIGNGSMMDAIRNEIKTGKSTKGKFHSTKGRNTIVELKKHIASGKLNARDKTVARALVDDIKKALSGN